MGTGDSGTAGTEDQGNSGYRKLEEQWAQRTTETVSTKNQRNSGHRAPEEQWVKRIRRTEDQRNSEYRGPEKRRTRGPEEQ